MTQNPVIACLLHPLPFVSQPLEPNVNRTTEKERQATPNPLPLRPFSRLSRPEVGAGRMRVPGSEPAKSQLITMCGVSAALPRAADCTCADKLRNRIPSFSDPMS